jgi:hypothetical protein
MQRSCQRHCFSGLDEIALARGIKELRLSVLSAKHKSQWLLSYMMANEKENPTVDGLKRKVGYRAPGIGKEICHRCFAHAAGFVQVDLQPSITFKRALSAFNDGDVTMDFTHGRNRTRRMDFSMEARIVAWIDRWLPGNHDKSPMNPDELHLNAKSKQAVWVICCDDFVREANLGADATEAEKNKCRPSKSYFLKVMREKYHCVIHKHKKFSQCSLCSMFKELTKKCRVRNRAHSFTHLINDRRPTRKEGAYRNYPNIISTSNTMKE